MRPLLLLLCLAAGLAGLAPAARGDGMDTPFQEEPAILPPGDDATAGPGCGPARDGALACMAGRQCVCRFERGGSLTGRRDGFRWDCGPLRPDCPAPPPADPALMPLPPVVLPDWPLAPRRERWR